MELITKGLLARNGLVCMVFLPLPWNGIVIITGILIVNHLIYFRHCSKHFIDVISITLHNIP